MTDAELHAQLQKTLAPHLALMVREISRLWPTLEPELVLLRWLCTKNNIEPPMMIFRRVDDDLQAHRWLYKLPKAAGQQPPKGPHSQRALSERAPASRELAPLSKTLLPLALDPQVPLPKPATPRRPEAKDFALVPLKHGAFKAPAPTTPSTTDVGSLAETLETTFSAVPTVHKFVPGLRTLGRLTYQVEDDARRHVVASDTLRDSNTHMRHMIANMRQGLRGQFLAKVPLLSLNILTEEEQFKLVGKLRPWSFSRGYNIISEGEIGDKLYIIERGKCEAVKRINNRETVVGTLGKGHFFGEIGALYDIPRTATVRTLTDVTALSLSREDLFSTIGEREILKMRIIARTQVFDSIPLLAKLSPKHKISVAENLKSQKWYKGANLAFQNHITSRLFIVEWGLIHLETKYQGNLQLALSGVEGTVTPDGINVGPGQVFGMRGLLYGAPVGFNISALTDGMSTLSISYEELIDCAEPDEREAMAKTIHDSMQAFLLRQIPQLSHLADNFFARIQMHAEEVHFKKWDVIFSKGVPFSSVYVLQKGKVVDHDGEAAALRELRGKAVNCIERAQPGEFFGAECLTHHEARSSCTLVAMTDVTMLRLPPEVVWEVLHEERQHINTIPLLSQDILTKAEQYRLVGKLKPWNFPPSCFIITEGQIGDMLFIIEQGVCEAIKEVDGREVVLTRMKKGSTFGELGVVFDMPRAATVRAVTDVVAVSLSREDLLSTVGPEKVHKMRCIAQAEIFHDRIPLLASLPTAQRTRLAGKLASAAFQPGRKIVEYRKSTDRLHIIERGTAEMVDSEGQLSALAAGSFFGMETLLDGAPYGCTVTAGPGEVATLSITLQDILDTAGTGEEPILKMTMRDALRCHYLTGIPWLKDRPKSFFKALFNHVDVAEYKAGDTVFTRGAPYGAIFVLEKGQLVEPAGDAGQEGSTRVLAKCFGGDGAVGTLIAPSTIVAATNCTLLRVPISALGTR